MGDNRTDLPEGTDTIIAGATNTDDTGGSAGAVATETSLVTESKTPAQRGDATGDSGLRQRLREGGERFSNEAGDRARGVDPPPLQRSADPWAHVSQHVGDTAAGLDERLGEEYGDYARRAASAIENTANSIASKNPDELIEDTRNFVRNSPGIAVAGAAIVGFALARLLKTGLSSDRDNDEDDA